MRLYPKPYTRNPKSGFSLVEALFVIGILIILSAVTVTALSRTNTEQSLEGATRSVIATINDARARTLASRNDTTYGVHIETNRIVLFSGSAYDADEESNEVKVLPPRVSISNISLGGGSDIVFARLSGEPSASGSLTLAANTEEAPTRTVVISATGLAYEE